MRGHSLPLGRHCPACTRSRIIRRAVVRPEISPPPPAYCTSVTPLNVGQGFVRLETIDGQLALMIAGPITLTLAIAIDQEPDAACAN